MIQISRRRFGITLALFFALAVAHGWIAVGVAAAPAHPSDQLLEHVPSGALAVAGWDIDALRTSPLFQDLSELLLGELDQQGAEWLKSGAAQSLVSRASYVVVAMLESGHVVLVGRAPGLTADSLGAVLKGAKRVTAIGQHAAVFEIDKSTQASLSADGLVVVGPIVRRPQESQPDSRSPGKIAKNKGRIRAKAAVSSSGASWASRLSGVDRTQPLWFEAIEPPAHSRWALPPDLHGAQRFFATASLHQGFRVNLRIRCANSDKCEPIERRLRGQLDELRGALTLRLTGVGRWLDAISLQRRGHDVLAQAAWSEGDMRAALELVAAALEIGRPRLAR